MAQPMLDTAELVRALSIRDLTDPNQGPHALQMVVEQVVAALGAAWGCAIRRSRSNPIVTVADNYDRLLYSRDATVRDARYSRYVCEDALLRTQTSSMIPPLLREIADEQARDTLLVCAGLVYRRDCIDRLHTGEPHQIDLWRVRCGAPLSAADLLQMIDRVVSAVLPGAGWCVTAVEHPYTRDGLQIDVRCGAEWIEIGECGLAHPEVLAAAGWPPDASGLAMGLGLDRLLMLRKGIDDIRLLRCAEPRVARQMLDLEPYRPVSRMPPAWRDLSLVLDNPANPEELGDAVRAELGADADLLESVTVLSNTPAAELATHVGDRLGIGAGQWNALVRVGLRALDRTLTGAECDDLRDRIYGALHRGLKWYWIGAPRAPGA